jgi:hypothetical protein
MLVILNFKGSKRNQFCSHPSHPPPNNSGHTYTQQWTNFLGAHESLEHKLCDIFLSYPPIPFFNHKSSLVQIVGGGEYADTGYYAYDIHMTLY